MTIYTDRIVLLFPIPEHGQHPARPAAASLQELEYTESGRTLENVVPLAVESVGEYAEQFSLSLIAERDSLAAQVASLTSAKSTLEARVAELEAELASGVDENGVPTAITPLQGRLALKRAGLLESVEAAIVQANGETQIWWEYATLWRRSHSLLNALATSLGLSSGQVDDLFKVAGAVE
ncbi:MAG: hypothetical protein E6R03_02900 [Hyphomicrobiaceae bacterium]|nr:MAG: hypothetical protein E6R03_02900 [Hyphomicrobiaceae bacterium]